MAPTPSWVKKLTPSGPQGSELLNHERSQSNLSVDKLAAFLFTQEVLDRKEKVVKILQAEKVFDKSQNYFDGRVDRFQTALARAKRLQLLKAKHKWDEDDYTVATEVSS